MFRGADARSLSPEVRQILLSALKPVMTTLELTCRQATLAGI